MTGHRRRVTGAIAGAALVAAVVAAIGWFAAAHDGTAGGGHRVAVSALPLRDSAPLAREVACPEHPGTATRTQLERFPAAAVLWCVQGEARYPDGAWTVVRKRISVGSVQWFLAALDRPDIPTKPNEMCAAVGYAPMPLTLVASDGRTLSPRLPTDSCGAPQRSALAALDGLHFVTVAVLKQQLEQSTTAIKARCTMQWKNENALLLDPRADASELPQGRLRVCWYLVHSDPTVGEFARGATLSAVDSARLRAALAQSRGPSKCLPQPRFAVVFAPNGAYADVELGGCYRVQTSGVGGQADKRVVAAILG